MTGKQVLDWALTPDHIAFVVGALSAFAARKWAPESRMGRTARAVFADFAEIVEIWRGPESKDPK